MNKCLWRHLKQIALLTISGGLLQSPILASDRAKSLGCQAAPNSYYHPEAIRLHESGAVLVEYSVSKKGRAERIVVLQATASKSLQESAVRYVSSLRCKPSKEWIKAGGPQERMRLNVLFQFTNEEPAKSLDQQADHVKITTPAIRFPGE